MSPRHVDLLLAAGVTLVLAVIVTSGQGGTHPVNPLAYVWTIGLGLLMLVRRSHPLLVLVLTAVGFFSYYAAGFPAVGVAVPIAAALFSAAEMGHARAAAVTGLGTLFGATAYRVADRQDLAFVLGYELATHVALIAAVIALGHSLRTSRQLRMRRDQVARLLDRQEAMDADVRARDDRLTLARELHDSIGHSLAVASLYAGLAREDHLSPRRRDESIAMARAAVSDALAHLRRTVRLLRGGADVATAPGLDDLPGLAQAPASAGYDVSLEVADVAVGPEIGSAVYRLVQEGITNVLRHSSGRRIGVLVTDEPSGDAVVVCITDDGTNDRPPVLTLGHGLSGMRERVADLGGELRVEAAADGWTVHARIPVASAG